MSTLRSIQSAGPAATVKTAFRKLYTTIMATNDVEMQDPAEGDHAESEPLMEAVEESGDADMDGV